MRERPVLTDGVKALMVALGEAYVVTPIIVPDGLSVIDVRQGSVHYTLTAELLEMAIDIRWLAAEIVRCIDLCVREGVA
jgi:hypothetical protein